MGKKLKLIFVCTINKMRSKTAEVLYRNDERFIVRSAGVAEDADVVLTEEMIDWADCIVAMEKKHVNKMKYRFPHIDVDAKLVCLAIPDYFYFMAPELIKQLKEKFEQVYKNVIKPKFGGSQQEKKT
ncbi:MAG: protein tyrosine phosphatase [bacterium]|nr:protein tyrosine phosphatase [bacterium]